MLKPFAHLGDNRCTVWQCTANDYHWECKNVLHWLCNIKNEHVYNHEMVLSTSKIMQTVAFPNFSLFCMTSEWIPYKTIRFMAVCRWVSTPARCSCLSLRPPCLPTNMRNVRSPTKSALLAEGYNKKYKTYINDTKYNKRKIFMQQCEHNIKLLIGNLKNLEGYLIMWNRPTEEWIQKNNTARLGHI